VDVQVALRGEERGEETDRARPQYQCPPPGPPHRVVELLPGLRDHAGGFEQHTGQAEGGVHPHGVVRFEPEPFGAEPVPAQDPPLGEPAVLAEVELPRGAERARNRVGAAHDADHEIARRDPRPGWCLQHPAQRLVAEDEIAPARRRLPGPRLDDVAIGPAHTQGECLDEELAVVRRGFGHVVEHQPAAVLAPVNAERPHRRLPGFVLFPTLAYRAEEMAGLRGAIRGDRPEMDQRPESASVYRRRGRFIFSWCQ
jgi:hypothetical protein